MWGATLQYLEVTLRQLTLVPSLYDAPDHLVADFASNEVLQ